MAATSMTSKKSLSSQWKEQAVPVLKGAAIVLDLNCQDVNGCLHILRKGLIRAGAKLVMDLSHDVACVISNRSSQSATATTTTTESSIPISLSVARSSRRRSAQLAQKAILPNITKTDLILKAKRLGTRVVSVDAVLKKLSVKSSDAVNKELPNYSPNKVAIQDLEERYRPIVKEFPNGVPRMRTDLPPGQCPFSNRKPSEPPASQQQSVARTSTHVAHQVPKKKRRVIVSGYCEICRIVANDVEEHLSSKEHSDLVDNDVLWTPVDVCIASLKLLSVPDTSKENIHTNVNNFLVISDPKIECES